jgi:hypothetical protein
MTSQERMEGLTALLKRIDDDMARRKANPLPRHEMTLAVWWLTLDKPPIYKVEGSKAA